MSPEASSLEHALHLVADFESKETYALASDHKTCFEIRIQGNPYPHAWLGGGEARSKRKSTFQETERALREKACSKRKVRSNRKIML